MAKTYAASGLTPQLWDDQFFTEYVRANRFLRYMGTDENAVIQLKDDLTNNKGLTVTFALVNELTGDGVTNNQSLEGNEERLDSRSMPISITALRHAVVVNDYQEQLSAIGLRNAAKGRLKMWAMKRLRTDLLTAFGSINGVAYASASEAQKDAWLVDNADRVLFGAAKSNDSGPGDHSAALANIDNTADQLDTGMITLAKEIAQTCSPLIHPIVVKEDEEWFVHFVGPRAWRDLKADTAMQQAQREALERGKDNPLFSGGDLMWDGVIIKKIPEIAAVTGVGAGGIDVEPSYFCGAQALGVAWAQRTKSITKKLDYDYEYGVAIQEMRGIEKLRFGTGAADTDDTKDNGLVTVWSAGVASS